MTTFYNEVDPYAAAWLENLIAAGYIAPGVVDRRPIQEIEAWELAEFTQCHFFAGIGIWSHALRRAGWSDDRPIWTGSCPCQPFSAAGQRKGISDERHLWPYWHQLIDQCRPAIVLGEQVASKDGLGWLDLVSTDLEASGYAFGASDLCAAGFGGAHIRQRLYFAGMANAAMPRRDGAVARAEGEARDQARVRLSGTVERASGLADTDDTRPQGRGRVSECASERAAGQGGVDGDGQPSTRCPTSGMADAEGARWSVCNTQNEWTPDAQEHTSANTSGGASDGQQRFAGQRPNAPLLGRDPADWLLCRDGKWRPVEPGTFPLVDAAPARVGRLRAYGNALDAETATNFCEVVREITDDLRPLEREFDL